MCLYKNALLDLLLFTEEEEYSEEGRYNRKLNRFVYPKSFMKRVKIVAESDLPNSCFIQQFFDTNLSYRNIKYWFGFAEVLRCRCERYGFSAIQDVSKEILIWWDYCDKPGFSSVYSMVLENQEKFMPIIKEMLQDIYFVRGIALTTNAIWAKGLPLDYRDYINYDWMIQLLGTLERIDATMTEEDHKNVDYVVGKLEDKDGKPLDDEDYKIFAELVGIDNESNG